MRLDEYKISKIKKSIHINNDNIIVLINVAGDTSLALSDKVSNIYCVNDKYEIIWQVYEEKTKIPFSNDLFVYMEMNDVGEIIAYRFSGFYYRINPDTGEAEQEGFSK